MSNPTGTLFDSTNNRVLILDAKQLLSFSLATGDLEILSAPSFGIGPGFGFANDFALLETHFFRGVGLRPYRIMQYPRDDMKIYGKGLVPTRIISRDLANGVIEEARIVSVETANDLDNKLFTLTGLQDPDLQIPNL